MRVSPVSFTSLRVFKADKYDETPMLQSLRNDLGDRYYVKDVLSEDVKDVIPYNGFKIFAQHLDDQFFRARPNNRICLTNCINAESGDEEFFLSSNEDETRIARILKDNGYAVEMFEKSPGNNPIFNLNTPYYSED